MTDDFIKKTNEEYVAWCNSYYNPEALDERGMISLHGLWAWQEQEQRMGELRQQLATTETRLEGVRQQRDTERTSYLNEFEKNQVLIKQIADSQKQVTLLRNFIEDASQIITFEGGLYYLLGLEARDDALAATEPKEQGK